MSDAENGIYTVLFVVVTRNMRDSIRISQYLNMLPAVVEVSERPERSVLLQTTTDLGEHIDAIEKIFDDTIKIEKQTEANHE